MSMSCQGGFSAWNRCMSLARLCSNMQQLKSLHALFITQGLHHNNYALSKLIAFCALSLSGSLPYASLLFHHAPQTPNSFIFNTLIRAYSRSSQPHQSLFYFRLMLSQQEPNHHTFAFALSACANIPSLFVGRQIHTRVFKNGLAVSDNFVQTGLLRVYVECRVLCDAHHVFDEIPQRDSVLWNVLINGYLRCGLSSVALGLFRDMLVSDTVPDEFCVATALTACAHSGALLQGAWIHDYARKNGFSNDVFIGTSLVDMFAKCGCIEKAINVFDEMPERNVFSWAAMIGGYAMHGFANEALGCLESMEKQDGLRPDGVVLLEVLTACSHAGLRDKGYHVLLSMGARYGVMPKHEHYSCMVDLLCRAGELDEAFRLIQRMPMRPLASVWGALLSGSRIYGETELAELAAEELLLLERDGVVEEDDGVYVQLSNVYLGASRQEDAHRIRKMMGNRGIKKTPGCSVIEVDGELNEFVAGDDAHPLRLQICAMVRLLNHHIIHHTSYSC
ncbi:putative pentatricopeptide repeat-containing protein At3g28640 [Tasmannia lanceolata]|uniref:putative pentatricopeptide repeat-containing protein At3g28640 n=1 Tax=Tasmannia lanceolata TaxID=3420 RepID=UPI004063BA29